MLPATHNRRHSRRISCPVPRAHIDATSRHQQPRIATTHLYRMQHHITHMTCTIHCSSFLHLFYPRCPLAHSSTFIIGQGNWLHTLQQGLAINTDMHAYKSRASFMRTEPLAARQGMHANKRGHLCLESGRTLYIFSQASFVTAECTSGFRATLMRNS